MCLLTNKIIIQGSGFTPRPLNKSSLLYIMRKLYSIAVVATCVLGLSVHAFAGNKDRSGQAGATELLINPWGQSSGVFGMNTAQVRGLDAMKTNIAGLSFVEKTEIGV